nr:HAMP domain-containing sensor histidine kinase [Spirosoma aerolatum]
MIRKPKRFTLFTRIHLLLFTLQFPLLNAQSVFIPGLRAQLAQATTDTARTRLLANLGYEYLQENVDTSLLYLNQSLRLARHVRDSVGATRALLSLAHAHHYYTHNEVQAITYLNQALKLAKANSNYASLSKGYQLMAAISANQRMGNPREYLHLAADYAQRANNGSLLAEAYAAHYELDRGQKRGAYHEKMLLRAMDASQGIDPDRWMTTGLDYCNLLYEEGRQAEAQQMARQLVTQTQQLQKRLGLFVYNADQARLLGFLGRYDEAIAAIKRGIAFEKSRVRPDSLHLFHYQRFLVETYTQSGNWHQAFLARDSVARLELWRQGKRQTRDAQIQMTRQEAAFKLEEKETQIKLLDAARQRQRLYLIGSILLASLLIGFVLVQRRTQQRIERQREQLAQLNTTKDKLFAILAHDLRSPVANLHNNVMLTNWGGMSQTEFVEATDTFGQMIGSVRFMLDNLLNWAITQISGFRARLQHVAIAPLVQAELDLIRPRTEQKGVQIRSLIPADTYLMADPNHVAVIIRNILHNALKFTPTGGTITLRYAEHMGKPQLEVDDTGVGMSPSN